MKPENETTHQQSSEKRPNQHALKGSAEKPIDKYGKEQFPPFQKPPSGPPGLESELTPAPRYLNEKYKGSAKLEGKVALITGGDSGIGRAVAVLFAREGATVAFTSLPQEKSDAQVTLEALKSEGQEGLSLVGDLTDEEFPERAVQATVEKFGGIDILVNNAAFQEHIEKLEDLTYAHWKKTFRTNIDAYFLMVKACLPHLKAGSSIINVGSVVALEGSKSLIDYSATKGAIHAFTRSLASQLVERQIRVNCVAPGPVWTPLNPAEREASDIKDFGGETPYGRPAQPEEIAPAFVFFASNVDSSYITGETIKLLGGEISSGS